MTSALISGVGSAAEAIGTAATAAWANPVAAGLACVSLGLLYKNRSAAAELDAAKKLKAQKVVELKNAASKVKALSAPPRPTLHPTRLNRRTDEHNIVQWKQILRRLIGIGQLLGVILPWCYLGWAAALGISLYFLFSFALTFRLSDHYMMNDPTKVPRIAADDEETLLNIPENRSNLENSGRFVFAAIFAPIAWVSLQLDSLVARSRQLAAVAQIN